MQRAQPGTPNSKSGAGSAKGLAAGTVLATVETVVVHWLRLLAAVGGMTAGLVWLVSPPHVFVDLHPEFLLIAPVALLYLAYRAALTRATVSVCSDGVRFRHTTLLGRKTTRTPYASFVAAEVAEDLDGGQSFHLRMQDGSAYRVFDRDVSAQQFAAFVAAFHAAAGRGEASEPAPVRPNRARNWLLAVLVVAVAGLAVALLARPPADALWAWTRLGGVALAVAALAGHTRSEG